MPCTRPHSQFTTSRFRLAALVVLCATFFSLAPASAHAYAVIQEAYSLLSWSGRWASVTSTPASGGALKSSLATGAVVTVAFDGTSLKWVGHRGPGGGRARVYLDGASKGVVDLSALGPSADRTLLWRIAGLRYAHHQVKIITLGSTDASGTGAVNVDAFVTDGRFSKVLQRATFAYPWNTYILIDKSQFRLYWVRDRWIVKTYKIAIGRVWSWTPQAVWKVLAKYKTDPSSVYGPRKMRLFRRVRTSTGYAYVYTAYGIHGTNEPWVIGTMASHGCIRLYNRDILELWPQVPLGTMVITRD